MIDNLFGLPSVASHTMERYTTSVLTATLTPPAEPVPEFRAMMQSLSEDSCNKYRQIVYEDPGPFFCFSMRTQVLSMRTKVLFFLSMRTQVLFFLSDNL